MAQDYVDYLVKFSFDGLTLLEQEKIYQLLVKNLTVKEKEKMKIRVEDSVGGIHDPFNATGVMPDGTQCELCHYIDCRMCPKYQVFLERE